MAKCQRCGAENLLTSAYCDKCGAALENKCSGCGHANRPGSYYCANCGRSLDAHEAIPKAALQFSESLSTKERKHVTVLFADIVDSTTLIRDLDPETGMLRLEPVLNVMRDAVERYDGLVAQTMGDGIMALFGSPKPHEDHALRGCLAAMAMQEAVGRLGDADLAIRVGLHTGETVLENSDLNYDVRGTNVHLASRMERMAKKGKILITRDTFNAARQSINAVSLGLQEVRGLSTPVEIFELSGLQHARASEYFRGSLRLSQFVGRDDELATLEKALASVRRSEARVVGVVGDAGFGKSRLCYEFAEACRRHDVTVREARVLEHGAATPFQPVLDLFRDFFGIQWKEPASISQQRVKDLLQSRGDFSEVLPLLLEFLGIPDVNLKAPKLSPETRKLRLLKFIRQLIHSRPADETVLLLLEDLHWIDSSSADFVEALAEAIEGTKTLLLVNFRPGFVASWMQRPLYQQIGLGPLGATPVQRLLQSLLGDDPSVVELGKQIANRAQGNPFFLEELIRSIADRGTLDGEVGAYRLKEKFDVAPLPQTVRAVIAARIDRLERRAKEVLQTASVIGRDVPLAVLERVVRPPASEVNEGLSHLRDADLFHELPPFDQSVFGFRHPLIQEVAYESLLQSKRRELHAAVASAIEAVFKDRLRERSGLLAFHCEQAGEFFKAAQSYVSAAVWVGATDSKQALRCWKKIPTLLDKAQPNQSTDYLRMMANGQIINFGWREGMPADEALKYFEEARRAAMAARDVHAIALIHAAYGRLLGATGSADDYVAKIQEAEAHAAESKDVSLQVTLKAVLCHALRLAGRMSNAIVVNTEASADAHNIGKFDHQMLGFDIGPWLIAMRGQTLVMLGRSVEARQYLDQILQMDPAAIDVIHYAIPSFGYMDLAFCENDLGLARSHAERLAKLAGDSGIPYLRTYADAYAGLSSIISGQLDDGIAQLGQALAFARNRRAGLENEARILADVANAYRLKGDLEAAKQWALESIAVATERHCRAPECFARIVLAEILCSSASATDRLSAEMEAEKITQLMAATGLLIYQKLFDGLKVKLAAFNDQAGFDGLRSKRSEPGRVSKAQESGPSLFNINVEGPAPKDPKANLGSI